jgi:hypothetical protein
MAGFNTNDNSISNGIPARQIGPETGSSGDATMTNGGETSEGTNEAADSMPAPAAGLQAPIYTGSDLDDSRSFASDPSERRRDASGPLDAADESPAQQIADGGDRIKHDDDLDDSKRG